MEWKNYSLADFHTIQDGDFYSSFQMFHEWTKEAGRLGYNLFQRELRNPPDNLITIYDEYQQHESKVINFSSYNYLGLANHPEVIQAAIEALKEYGLGACGSPMLSGTFKIHNDFQKKLADFKNKEDVLLYPSGYSGNVGALSAILRMTDVAIVDRYAHASIVDGVILSKAGMRYFGHNNLKQLENCLKKEIGKPRKLIIVEGIYSMDGDLPDLPGIVDLAQKYKSMLMIDEAHSTLIFGENGRGVAEHFGLEDYIDISFGTLSKAFGGIGGFIAGKKELIEYLKYYSRSRFFSCNLPPAMVAGVQKALEIFQKNPSIRERLWKNVEYMKQALRSGGIDIGNSQSQVIPVLVNDDKIIYDLGREILTHGLFVQPVVYPAVKKNQSRFRLSVTAKHTTDDMDRAAAIIKKCFSKYQLPGGNA